MTGLALLSCLVRVVDSQSPPADVAVVTGLDGKAHYDKQADGQSALLDAFQQVASGSIVELSDDTALTLVFFTGRRETWNGPAVLKVGPDGSESIDPGNDQARPTEVRDEVPTQIEALPHVAGTARSAVNVVMAPVPFDLPPSGDCRHWRALSLTDAERDVIERADGLYRRMREQAPPGDFTAEAYWLSVLGQYDQFARMTPVLERLDGQLPNNPTVARLKARVANCASVLQ